MTDHTYQTLSVSKNDGIVWVTFNNPPINLLNMDMIRDIDVLSRELEADQESRVVVFQSANPEFFIAHADVDLIRNLPAADARPVELNLYVAALERIRTLPIASIGKIAGIARGGGSEFLLSLDMRFAASGPTLLSQPEVALGIFPTGSGSQRLPRLLGRARALEVALGCDDFTAEDAGFVNNVMNVNTEELKHSPSVAIIEYGQGVWIHGPETVARIANYAPAFAQKAAQ